MNNNLGIQYNKSDLGVTGSMKDNATKKYIKKKLQLIKDLEIKLTEDQIAKIKSLRTEYEVDRYCRDIIWG